MATRRCIGCGKTGLQQDLLRFNVREPGDLLLAVLGSQGRSAYLCPKASCFSSASKRKAFNRAFRRQVREVSVPRLQEMIQDVLEALRLRPRSARAAKVLEVLETMSSSLLQGGQHNSSTPQ